ncbi:MAG: hypothetical protein WC848_04060 [Parcubacteria group bacterium]|jgi:predicted GH43/DUF377 family glycosyl hydrolase
MDSHDKVSWFSLSAVEKTAYLFYRKGSGKDDPIRASWSLDGINFFPLKQKVSFKNKFLNLGGRFDVKKGFRISKIADGYFLSYCPKNGSGQTAGAVSVDGLNWKKVGPINKVKQCGAVVNADVAAEKYLMFFGERSIRIASSPDAKKWSIKRSIFLRARAGYFDSQSVSVAGMVRLKEGLVLTYVALSKSGKTSLGAVLLDKNNYRKILWRSKKPIWKQPEDWKGGEIDFVGSYYKNGKFLVYWDFAGELKAISITRSLLFRDPVRGALKLKDNLQKKVDFQEKISLCKHANNPILKPIEEHAWECCETFNPAAIFLNSKVHLLYRALGERGISVLGYASSKDGITIDERLKKPVYAPMQPFENGGTKKKNIVYPYSSGGSWSGCEDPRLSVIGKRIYMTYVTFNGSCPPGVALTSIKVKDFLAKNWNWKIPKLISKPGEIQKNWVVFPEKIKGKFAVLHSISPNILIDYFDSLDKKKITITSYHNNKSDEKRWDNILRGVGAPPIKTDYGWLVFYHAMDKRDPNRYKVGAMILDYNNPEKILHRSVQPILEPVEKYENEGSKAGVVYVCGSVIKDGKIFVYYGGADKFTCVATTSMDSFLSALVNSSKTAPFIRLAVA